MSAAEPLIRPGIDNRAGETPANNAFDVPAQHLRLLLLGMPNRIHAEFTKDERLVVGQILKARQIAIEIILPVQVDIECHEVAVLRQEILGGRIAGVGEKRARVFLAADVDQLLDEFRNLPRTQPAHHGRRDFIADQITKDGRMPCVFAHPVANRLLRLVADFRVVEKLQMLSPWNRDQRPNPPRCAQIQEPARRHIVNAHKVHARLDHHVEILGSRLGSPKVVTLRIRRERPIGHPLDEKLFIPLEEKLGAHAHWLHFSHDGWYKSAPKKCESVFLRQQTFGEVAMSTACCSACLWMFPI